jgi:hypothetical protein
MLVSSRALLAPVLASSFLLAPAARAQGDKRAAAAAFDAAVARYEKAEFAEAAQGFLEADRLAPSAVAITNAIAAARRASDHLLAARAAERAIARGDALVEARAALADAAAHLGRLEVSCDVTPCAVTVDGEPAVGASVYVLPGVHRVAARSGTAAVEQSVACIAGAAYRLPLHPVVAPPPSRPSPPAWAKPVFFGGVGLTAALAAVTTGLGLDALAAKRGLSAAPTRADEDAVMARAHRTTAVFVGAVAAAIGTTICGVVAYRAPRASVAVAPASGGASLLVEAHF